MCLIAFDVVHPFSFPIAIILYSVSHHQPPPKYDAGDFASFFPSSLLLIVNTQKGRKISKRHTGKNTELLQLSPITNISTAIVR